MKKSKIVLALTTLCFVAFTVTGCGLFKPKKETVPSQEDKQTMEQQAEPAEEMNEEEVQEAETEENQEETKKVEE